MEKRPDQISIWKYLPVPSTSVFQLLNDTTKIIEGTNHKYESYYAMLLCEPNDVVKAKLFLEKGKELQREGLPHDDETVRWFFGAARAIGLEGLLNNGYQEEQPNREEPKQNHTKQPSEPNVFDKVRQYVREIPHPLTDKREKSTEPEGIVTLPVVETPKPAYDKHPDQAPEPEGIVTLPVTEMPRPGAASEKETGKNEADEPYHNRTKYRFIDQHEQITIPLNSEDTAFTGGYCSTYNRRHYDKVMVNTSEGIPPPAGRDGEKKGGLFVKWYTLAATAIASALIGAGLMYSCLKPNDIDTAIVPVPDPIIELDIDRDTIQRDLEDILENGITPAELPLTPIAPEPVPLTYTIESTDNLVEIAGMHLPEEFDTARHRYLFALQIAAHNQIENPNLIRPGWEIVIPHYIPTAIAPTDIKVAEMPFMHTEPAFIAYTVERTDNLNKIAGMFIPEEFNTPTHRQTYALQIHEFNDQIENPHLIFPGQEIAIPRYEPAEIPQAHPHVELLPLIDDDVHAPADKAPQVEDIPVPDYAVDAKPTEVGLGWLAIGHEDEKCNAIFNYELIAIPGHAPTIITDMLDVHDISIAAREYWADYCMPDGIIFGTPEESTTYTQKVPIEVREEADRIRYGTDRDSSGREPKDEDSLEDLLINDNDHIPGMLNNNPRLSTRLSSEYDGTGNSGLHIGSLMQLEYVLSKTPEANAGYSLSEHNMKQVIQRGANIDSAYVMRNDGMSVREIAKALNRSTSTVYRYLKEANRIEDAKSNGEAQINTTTQENSQSHYKIAAD
jgi:nucleoid-associated protein YgaU